MEALGPDSTFLMRAKSLLRRQCWSFRLVVGGPGAPPNPALPASLSPREDSGRGD